MIYSAFCSCIKTLLLWVMPQFAFVMKLSEPHRRMSPVWEFERNTTQYVSTAIKEELWGIKVASGLSSYKWKMVIRLVVSLLVSYASTGFVVQSHLFTSTMPCDAKVASKFQKKFNFCCLQVCHRNGMTAFKTVYSVIHHWVRNSCHGKVIIISI